MTDRELLELAAKAAGMGRISEGVLTGCILFETSNGWVEWSPLTDDGDAFRLAVTLNMCVTSFTDGKMAGFVIGSNGYEVNEENDGDPLAATRRVIVRAAAEIGKAM